MNDLVFADADGGPGPWRLRRSPVPVAIAGIVAIALAGWGLRTWGAVNPAVDLDPTLPDSPDPTLATAALTVHDGSHSSVTVTGVAIEADRADAGPVPKLVGLAPPTRLPLTVRPGQDRVLHLRVMTPRCPADQSGGAYHYTVRVRTGSGRTMALRAGGPDQLDRECPPPLPTPGVQPADLDAARAAIAFDYAAVYDESLPIEQRTALIDDPTGLPAAVDEARHGFFGGSIDATRAEVTHVTFDRPDHAWLLYDLDDEDTGRPFGSPPHPPARHSWGFIHWDDITISFPSTHDRVGEARLVDGRWKVTRMTVCHDLQLVQVTCPASAN